jgi:hypothetical protein
MGIYFRGFHGSEKIIQGICIVPTYCYNKLIITLYMVLICLTWLHSLCRTYSFSHSLQH